MRRDQGPAPLTRRLSTALAQTSADRPRELPSLPHPRELMLGRWPLDGVGEPATSLREGEARRGRGGWGAQGMGAGRRAHGRTPSCA